MPPILAGIVPFVVFALIILGTGVEWIAWSPPQLWANHFGEAGPITYSGATAVAIDNTGLYVGGYANLTDIRSQVVAGLQGSAFLIKYNFGGHSVWTATSRINMNSSSAYRNPIAGIVSQDDGVYVAANYNGSSFMMKYDQSGNKVWTNTFGGTNIELDRISATDTGIYAIGRGFNDHGESFRKYDLNGNLIWNRSSSLRDVNASPLGIYGLTTTYLARYDSSGNELWTQPIGCQTVKCPVSQSLSNDGTALYVLEADGSIWKYEPDGSVIWTTHFQLPRTGDSAQALSMSSGASGIYLYVVPYLESGHFLVKFDSNGGEVWSRQVSPHVWGWDGSPLTAVGPPCLSAGSDGLYLVGSNGAAVTEKFAESSSLIFFGVNPPWSFVTLGTGVAVITTGLTLLIRKYRRKGGKRVPSGFAYPVVSGRPAD